MSLSPPATYALTSRALTCGQAARDIILTHPRCCAGGPPMWIHRRRLLQLAGAFGAAASSQAAAAETYPSRPVRILVGYAAGGGLDIAARTIGQWLSERLGQQFVVENRTGAATNIA